MNYLLELLSQYGYIILVISLSLELIALPLPGEALMMYCGYLVYMHKLNWGLSILFAASGSIAGMTISYFIGRILEEKFFEKYGHYLHMGPDNLEKISAWFERYGNILLVTAYYIPGVRHMTGYFSGVTKIPYKEYARYTYSGAVLWAATFISLGKIFGPKWEQYHKTMSKYFIVIGLIITVITVSIYFYYKYKLEIIEFTVNLLDKGFETFHSMGKVKIAVAAVAAAFLALSALAAAIVDAYLGNELKQFDNVVRYVFSQMYDENIVYVIKVLKGLASGYAFILMILATAAWAALKGKNKMLEIKFTFIGGIGAFIFSEILTAIFQRTGPLGIYTVGNDKFTFPSGEALMAVVVYGFLTYLMIRHSKRIFVSFMSLAAPVTICSVIGFSLVYLNLQYPSDVLAGFVFGGIWLSLNIVLLEIYRVIPVLKISQ